MTGGLTRRLKLLLALAPVCFLGAMVPEVAEARENYALIVADSDYPNLDQKYWLKGPKNDEVLVRDYLINNAPVKFEPQNVIALGSGEGMQLGTHQAILDSLAKLASEAKAGDFVYLHFSGHGSQQPAKADKSEADGRDEIFLSADTEMAPADNPSFLPNVLTDDEVSSALKAIRKTGAFVWVVFDSCHSGTMTRGAPEDGDTAERKIDPADLGIPDSAFTTPAPTDDASRAVPLAGDVYADDDDPNMGGLVAFFAAQTSETTQERGFDVPQADGTTSKIPYGVFTYTIFSSLAKNPNMTYRQLAQSVLASYAAQNTLKPTPLFEGKLDAPVFGNEDAVTAEQWPTVVGGDGSLTISAGQLHGLDAGTKLLLLPSPSASNDQAIGLMEVQSATQLRAKLIPASDDKHPLIDAKAVPMGAYVRLAEQTYPFELTVAKPDAASPDADGVAAVQAALDSILQNAHAQLKLKVVDAGQPADVKLALLSDADVGKLASTRSIDAGTLDATPKLWLLPATGEVSLDPTRRAPAIDLPAAATRGVGADPDFTKGLEDNLVTIFRATSLSRLTQASTFKPKDFALTFGLQQAGTDTVTAMAPEDTPIIRPHDRVYVDLANTAGKPVDINVLYVDHNYGITLVCQSHLASGDHLFQPMADIDVSDQGSERLIAVINESGKDLTDLSFLTQPGISPATRGVDNGGLLGMLADLGSGVPTRGPTIVATSDTKTPRGAVVMVPVEVLEPTDKQAAAEIPISDTRTPEGSCAS